MKAALVMLAAMGKDEMVIQDNAAEDNSAPAAEAESYYESDSRLYDIQFADGDELSELAFGLEQMRLSLNENIREKEEIMEVNNRLVTGMAHDLRTPLTALLLYTELLSQGKYKDEKEMEQYLKKTANKANQIKQMSDDLFERECGTAGISRI